MIDSTIFIPLLPRRRGMKILYPRRPRTHLIHNPQIVSKLKSAAESPPSPHRSDENAFPVPPSPSGK